MIATQDITGLVLAGGRGSRMGGLDKGLQAFHGTPLAQHALQRLRPQVGQLALSANRNLADYQRLGVPVWPDMLPDYAGPLAGMLTGLAHCQTPWLVTVACDTPLFPHDLVARLAAAAAHKRSSMAVALAPANDATLRRQPVFCLLHRSLLASLQAFLGEGARKVGAWASQHPVAEVAFNAPGDSPSAFLNANTAQELQALQALQRGPA